jgi:uncharacterized integral membrane protein (TIGR00698 family)
MTNVPAAAPPITRATATLRTLGPGIVLSLAVAVAAVVSAPLVGRVAPIPAMVIALFIGIARNSVAMRPAFQPGLIFCVKKLLRRAVALLGLRIALGDIVALGLPTALLVVASMAATVVSGFMLARVFGQDAGYGALAGAGTAVCSASATLATSTVLPNYLGKEADIVFVVVAVNALSTVATVLYPPLCSWLGFDAHSTGVMLGATIHDVAQVVGAGYAVSDTVGNAAVIVKLFRVFLLLPMVLAIGWWFARAGAQTGDARVPVPVFALVFLALCIVNSILVPASTWGLLIAIVALDLGTSLTAIGALGWRHVATVTGTTLVILVIATAGLLVLR